MPDSSSLSTSQAFGRWVLFTLIVLASGGTAAGLTALGYEWISGDEYARELYALVFGLSGYIAYRLAQQVIDGPAS
jgi:hypothetical protein